MKQSNYKKKKPFKRILYILCLSIALMIGSDYLNATSAGNINPQDQQQSPTKVTGLITDNKNEPLIGVSVTIKGTTAGTVTDIDGKYSLNISGNNPVLVFSYVGFKPQTHTVKSGTLNIVMEEDSKLMKEVVIVGYGAQKKENLTGAVASVDVSKTLEGRAISDVGRGLQGAVPGLSVTLPSAEIGSDPSMKIRAAIGSINGKSDPLILLDNVEIPSIQMVNPDDIESISVLKDAAASSIYGAKAAFGVILISTKKGGHSEKVDVQYSNNFSWQNIAKEINMGGLSTLEYAMDAYERSGNSFGGGNSMKIDRESIQRTKEWVKQYGGTIGINDPMVYGRDWYKSGLYRYGVRLYNPADYMINDWSPTQQHNLSIGGSTNKTVYNISLGLLNQKGMNKPAKHDDFKRYNASIRLSSEINKYVTVRGGAMYSNRNKRSPYTGTYASDPWYYMYRWSPVVPYGVDEYGDPLRSPAFEMAEANTATRENSYTSINLGATFNITKNWNIIADFAYARDESAITYPGTRFTALDVWLPPTPRVDGFGNPVHMNNKGEVVDFVQGDPNISQAHDYVMRTYSPIGSAPDIYRRESKVNKRGTASVFSTYDLKFGQDNMHAFKFMAGIDRVTNDLIGNWTQRSEVFDPKDPQMAQTTGKQEGDGSFENEAQLGYFGRVNYMLRNKYLFEANLRYDGSSKYTKNLRWNWYPSFSAGWIASEEQFMQSLKPVLSFLKLRGSWGSIGDQTVKPGLYAPQMPSVTTNWLGSSTENNGFKTPLVVQSDITWQNIETLNLGFDMRFINDKLGLSADWYQRTTKNMVATGPTLPLSFGAASAMGNYAELRTRGWELALDFNHKFPNGLSINATAALSDAISVFTDFYDKEAKSLSGYYVGKTYGEIWGYTTDRLYQKEDFEYDASGRIVPHVITAAESQKYQGRIVNALVNGNPVYQPFLEKDKFMFGPGDVKYKDLNGDGFIDNGTNSIDNYGDLSIIGNSNPRYEYSFRVGADYKGVDFSVFIQGIGKRDLWGDGQLAIPGYNVGDGAVPEAIADDYWTSERPNAFYPRPWNMGASNTGYNMERQTRYLLDMSYLRIKNITLGYSLPQNLIKKAYLSKARVYFSMENFLTFDKLRGLPIDPETVSGRSMFTETDNYGLGRTGIGAPAFRSLSFGLQLNF